MKIEVKLINNNLEDILLGINLLDKTYNIESKADLSQLELEEISRLACIILYEEFTTVELDYVSVDLDAYFEGKFYMKDVNIGSFVLTEDALTYASSDFNLRLYKELAIEFDSKIVRHAVLNKKNFKVTIDGELELRYLHSTPLIKNLPIIQCLKSSRPLVTMERDEEEMFEYISYSSNKHYTRNTYITVRSTGITYNIISNRAVRLDERALMQELLGLEMSREELACFYDLIHVV